MSLSPLSTIQIKAYRLLITPAIAVILVCFAFAIQGKHAFLSAGLGGLTWLLPNFYFVYRVFSAKGSEKINALLPRFYRAEIIKLCLTGILVVIVIKVFSVEMLSFLITFFAAQVIFWFNCLLMMR